MKRLLPFLVAVILSVIARDSYASNGQPLYDQQSLTLDTLQRYVGEYELAPDQRLTVSLSDDTLYILPPNETNKAALKRLSDTEFIVVGEQARLIFKKDASGTILAVEIRFGNGASATGKKL